MGWHARADLLHIWRHGHARLTWQHVWTVALEAADLSWASPLVWIQIEMRIALFWPWAGCTDMRCIAAGANEGAPPQRPGKPMRAPD